MRGKDALPFLKCAVFTAAFFYALNADAAECGTYDKVKAFLAKKYQERVYATGLVGPRGAMEIYVSEAGTWTVLLTTPQKISCIVAAGDSWADVPMEPPASH